jgi:hypothetical protein
MNESKDDHLPLLKRPLKPGQLPPVGLTPPPPQDKAAKPPQGQSEAMGGPEGAEPTRFGDWERKGRCSDF